MTDKERCRGCRQEPSIVALEAMWHDAQLEETMLRYPGLMPRSTSNHRIMISTVDSRFSTDWSGTAEGELT